MSIESYFAKYEGSEVPLCKELNVLPTTELTRENGTVGNLVIFIMLFSPQLSFS